MFSFICDTCNQETIKYRKRGSLTKCQKCVKKLVLASWKKKYPERKKELNQRWVEENRDKDRQSKRLYQITHRELENAKAAKYRAKKKQAFPIWASKEKIESIYLNCPKGYHVDHIIPLNGAQVSGLHVEFNLQYLPALDNIKKSNKFEGNP